MIKYYLPALVLMSSVLVACGESDNTETIPAKITVDQANDNHDKLPTEVNTLNKDKLGSKIEGPEFSVKVVLSDKAKAKLLELGESITISSLFDGSGEVSPEDKDAYPEVSLGAFEVTIKLGEVADFKELYFSTDDIKRLDKGYQLTINVYTARKTVEDNLLSCVTPIGVNIDTVRDSRITVSCALIEETPSINAQFMITGKKNPTVNVTPKQEMSSPYNIEVHSQGLWSGFEGELGKVLVVDDNGNELGMAVLSAIDENWMREGDVLYGKELSFDARGAKSGMLQFYNNNPAGDEGINRYFETPVRFK